MQQCSESVTHPAVTCLIVLHLKCIGKKLLRDMPNERLITLRAHKFNDTQSWGPAKNLRPTLIGCDIIN